ncbi:MAG: 50S ribosomal protein L21 [Candidatus Aminicenantes bacterium]|nr:50S ribosomal protein L21 [Candidatus Aminicenantes bacterium]
MYAILETGGKQYKVEEGDIIEVEHIDEKNISKENNVSFSEVLLINDKELYLGQPYVKDARIEAKILEGFKAPKIIVFKKKSKKGYKRTRGHRQILHRLKIEKIEIKKVTKTAKVDTISKDKKTEAVKVEQQKSVSPPKKTVSPRSSKTASAKPKRTTKNEKEKK